MTEPKPLVKKEIPKPPLSLANDHVWFKPDEFTLVKISNPAGDAYVISFLEHVIQPLSEANDGSGNFEVRVERRARATIQISRDFFKSLVKVAEDVEKRSTQGTDEGGSD
ncbi:MAG: hypothetical protein HYX43_16330 [Burkholderiales bacterium]|nr:hypothetical protein [Burkholderiales bacterium]